jgi:hypothetical protein
MLTSRTQKELSGHWQKQRESALKDSSGCPTTGLFTASDLNVGIEGNGINDPLSFKIDTTPADGYTTKKTQKYDIRDRPGAD